MKETRGEEAAGRLHLKAQGTQQGLGQGRDVVRFGFGEGAWLSEERTTWRRARGGVGRNPAPRPGREGGCRLSTEQPAREAPLVRCFGKVMAIPAHQMLEENGEEGGDPKGAAQVAGRVVPPEAQGAGKAGQA